MPCPSWQWHRTGSSWSPVRTLQVAPLWCDLGFVLNSRGNKAAANLRPTFIYVSIRSNMQICWTMYNYDVLCTKCIYVLIWQFFHIYLQYMYSITNIYIPIRVYTCYTYVRANTYHKNTYKNIYKNTSMQIRTIIQTIMYIYTCSYGSEIPIRANTYRTVY